MKVYIARHAEARHNPQDLFHDETVEDVDLTEKGILQAEELAEKLRQTAIDVIFVSELMRTKRTAEIVNQYHNVRIITDKLLNDIKSGIAGRPVGDFRDLLSRSDDPWNAHFPGGESYDDVTKRVLKFLHKLQRSNYDNVLVVTSGGIVNNLYGYAHNLSYDEMYRRPVDNASLVEIELGGLMTK